MRKLEILRADLSFEATYSEPDFGVFGNTPAFLAQLFKRLGPQPNGPLGDNALRTRDVRVDSTGSLNDVRVVCQVPFYALTINFHVDRVEVVCSDLPSINVEVVKRATLAALTALTAHRPELVFKTFQMSLSLHGKVEGQSGRDFLSTFASNIPGELGPTLGNGLVFYFGASEDRLNSSITADLSLVVPEGLWCRIQARWDGQRLGREAVMSVADPFRQLALRSIGLEPLT